MNFDSVREYIEARRNHAVSSEVEEIDIDGFDSEGLRRLSSTFWIPSRRKIAETIVMNFRGQEISLKVGPNDHTPFMKPSGELYLPKKIFYHKKELILSLAHELSHFLLLGIEHYENLWAIDKAFVEVHGPDSTPQSPIEYMTDCLVLRLLRKQVELYGPNRLRNWLIRHVEIGLANRDKQLENLRAK